jgi:hypothetical protein
MTTHNLYSIFFRETHLPANKLPSPTCLPNSKISIFKIRSVLAFKVREIRARSLSALKSTQDAFPRLVGHDSKAMTSPVHI